MIAAGRDEEMRMIILDRSSSDSFIAVFHSTSELHLVANVADREFLSRFMEI